MTSTTVPAIIAGAAGLLVFLVIHHFWIMPIWFILPLGLVISSLGGLAVGQAYQQLLPHLPPPPWSALALTALFLLTLLPAVLLAELLPPMFDITAPAHTLNIGTGRAAVIFILELLLTATLMGGFAGWLIGHTGGAAIWTAVAAFVFALGPGHNIPFLGNTPASGKGFLLLSITVLVSSLVLVGLHHWLQLKALQSG